MASKYDISETPSIYEEMDKTDFHVLKTSYSHATRHLVRRRSLILNDPRECFRIPHRSHRHRSNSTRSTPSSISSSRPSSRCHRMVPERSKTMTLHSSRSSHRSTQVSPPLLSGSPIRTAVKHLPGLIYRIPVICDLSSHNAVITQGDDKTLSAVCLLTHQIEPSPFRIWRHKSYMSSHNYYPKCSKVDSNISALQRHASLLDGHHQELPSGDLEPRRPNIDDYPSEIESASEILQKVHRTPRGRIAHQEHYNRSPSPSNVIKHSSQLIDEEPLWMFSFNTSEGYFTKQCNWIIENPELRRLTRSYSTKITQSELVRLIGLFIRPSTQFNLDSNTRLIMDLEDEELFGIIRVANMDYHKSVIVRVSWNRWFSYTDYRANYMAPNRCLTSAMEHNLNDYFSFQIPLEFKGDRIEFAVKYSWGNAESNQTVWDNNNGKNYVIHYDPRRYLARTEHGARRCSTLV